MITKGILGVKTALVADLVKADGSTAIFTDISDIDTGYPHPDLISKNPPTVDNPLVAVYYYGMAGASLGMKAHRDRSDVTVGGDDLRRDSYTGAELMTAAEVHILAKTADELVGTATWDGYVEQVLKSVIRHPSIIGPDVGENKTIIKWYLEGEVFSIPGITDVTDTLRVFLGIVKTQLAGYIVADDVDAAQITELYPHDGEFDPDDP